VIPALPPATPAAPPFPVHVGVVYAPFLPERVETIQLAESSWALPVGPASVAALNAVSRQLFAVASDGSGPQPERGGPDALLSIDVEHVRLRAGPFRPEQAEVRCSAVLTDRAGVELARASATELADGAPVHAMGLFHCDALGSATSAALARAATRIRDELAASPRVQAWARERAATAQVIEASAAPTAAPPELPAPPQPPERTRWHRPFLLPRFMGGEISSGTVSSPSPGIGTQSSTGWGIYWAWDFIEWLDVEMRGGAMSHRVGWTPNPADTSSGAESGFFGTGPRIRFLSGGTVRPWIAADLAYQATVWSSYYRTVGGWGLLGSVGIDLYPVSWGAVRLAASYSAFTAVTHAVNGPTSLTPQPSDPGASAPMRTWWLSAGWIFDLGPAR
jgi:hypothetical protein